MRRVILRVYDGLLRLYPRHFRDTFAVEMRDVFAQAVDEASPFRLVELCRREMVEMPMSLIREHLYERQALRGMEMVTSSGYTFTYRFCVITILTGVILYLTLIILPFLAYGLHLENPDWVGGGSFDPKDFPIFSSPTTAWLRLIGILTLALFPVWNTFFGLRLAFSMGRNWRHLSVAQRRFAVITLSLGVALMAFIFSPAGRLIMRWYGD